MHVAHDLCPYPRKHARQATSSRRWGLWTWPHAPRFSNSCCFWSALAPGLLLDGIFFTAPTRTMSLISSSTTCFLFYLSGCFAVVILIKLSVNKIILNYLVIKLLGFVDNLVISRACVLIRIPLWIFAKFDEPISLFRFKTFTDFLRIPLTEFKI